MGSVPAGSKGFEGHVRPVLSVGNTYAKTCRDEHVTWLTAQKKYCATSLAILS